MKRVERSSYLLLLILMGAALVGGYMSYQRVLSQDRQNNVKIGVVDSARIKSDSKPFIRVKEMLDEQHKKAHQEILEMQTQLRREFDELRASKLTAPQMQEKRQDFDKKVAALEQLVHHKKEKIRTQFAELYEKLEHAVKFHIEKISNKYGFTLVLNKYIQETLCVLYSELSYDITKEVIENIERELKDVTLPVEK